MALSDKDRKLLWAKAGGLCSFNYGDDVCMRKLIDNEAGDDTVVGEECHIVGDKKGSARYVEDFPERNSYSNMILMCRVHHKIIDDNESIYTIEKLRNMKKRHENKIKQQGPNLEGDRLLIENSSFNTSVQDADIAVGMEVNRPTEIRNVHSTLKASNVREAKGFVTNHPLTSSLIFCDCGKPFSRVFTGQPPSYIKCPHCGKKFETNR